jgi:hypothetical protein
MSEGLPERRGVKPEHPGGCSESHGGDSENIGEFSDNLREEIRNEVTINKNQNDSNINIEGKRKGMRECLRRPTQGRWIPVGSHSLRSVRRLIENLYNRKPKATAMEQHVPRPMVAGIHRRKNVSNMRPKTCSLSPKACPGRPKATAMEQHVPRLFVAGVN